MPIRMEDAAVYLSHHGIKGQKWGVRNGPPYPLDAATSARVKASAKSGTRTEDSEIHGAERLLIPLIPTTLSFAAGVISKAKRRKRVEDNSNAKPYADERNDEEIDPDTGLYLKKHEMSMEEDIDRVNPSYGKDDYFSTNCALCTTTMEMRRRGYDVHASTLLDSPKNTASEQVIDSWFVGGSSEKFKRPSTDIQGGYLFSKPTTKRSPDFEKYAASVMNEIRSYGDGARGRLHLDWVWGGGHSVFVTVEKGNPVIYDTQTHKKYATASEIEEFLLPSMAANTMRLDNLKPNIEAMKKYGIFE